jgi:uncharacterized protein YcbK (DUF882 family)|tara:strand:- start:10 stop:399 length:390 start_codon:yes stop_codon:yes gene_type:complete
MRYFKISEFDSPDEKGSGKNMSPLFLDFLDELRHRCKFPFRVTSGYRTQDYHQSLTDRGYHTIKNSAHLKGLAADIAISDSVKRAYFVGHALELVHLMGLPFRLGISKKNSFIHIDIDETKTNPRMWIY